MLLLQDFFRMVFVLLLKIAILKYAFLHAQTANTDGKSLPIAACL
jgi:hypothetical protein